ncbi:hypothetical protein ACYOEI_08850 [Singulisphaera rosea]
MDRVSGQKPSQFQEQRTTESSALFREQTLESALIPEGNNKLGFG